MRTHSIALASIVAASIFSGSPAHALEARETRSLLILDVPATWVVERQGEYVRAHPRDMTFQVSLAGSEHGAWTESEANTFLWTTAATGGGRSLSQMHAATPAPHKIEWSHFTGYEIFGTAKMANGYDSDLKPAKWFGIVLVDKTDMKKCIYAVGWGTPASYDQNEPGIYTAMHTLRSYTE